MYLKTFTTQFWKILFNFPGAPPHYVQTKLHFFTPHLCELYDKCVSPTRDYVAGIRCSDREFVEIIFGARAPEAVMLRP